MFFVVLITRNKEYFFIKYDFFIHIISNNNGKKIHKRYRAKSF